MKNAKIQKAMIDSGLKYYELASLLGIHAGSLSRKLKKELPIKEQKRIIEVIKNGVKAND